MNSWFFRTLHVHFSYSLVFLFRTPYVFSFFIYILLWPAKPYDFIQPGECTRVVFLMSYFSFLHRAVLFVRHTLIRYSILVCVVCTRGFFVRCTIFRMARCLYVSYAILIFVCHTSLIGWSVLFWYAQVISRTLRRFSYGLVFMFRAPYVFYAILL